jgi:hypothetical protein
METKNKKEFDAVGFMREQRKILSEKLAKMTKSEIVDYFKRKGSESEIRPPCIALHDQKQCILKMKLFGSHSLCGKIAAGPGILKIEAAGDGIDI